MKKNLFRVLTGVVAVLIFAGMVIYILMVRSLPQLDGEISAPGLSADVSIVRDENGIPTITATNRSDLAYATGFVHGQDRFFQMDLTRRKAAGELSEIVGVATLPVDRRSRLHRFRARAARVLARLSDSEDRILEAYAAGVNAGVASLGTQPPEYYLLRAELRPWEKADTLLAVYSMFMELNDETAERDIDRGLAANALPAPAFEWLFPAGTSWDAPLNGPPHDKQTMPGPAEYSLRKSSVAVARYQHESWPGGRAPGSNNWAIAGQLTTSGRAIVANDMHLSLAVPNVFYRARLRVTGEGDIDLIGLTLPGAPILVAGSNGSVAWGNTNSNGDWSDAVIIREGDEPGTYLTPAGAASITTHFETILVKGQQPETLEVRETIWGPILETNPDPEQTIAVSWIAHHVEGVSLGHLDLETVENVSAALDVANNIGMPPQNFVAGDVDGNIGWTIAGRIPLRVGGDSQIPVDWSVTEGWAGWLAPEQYPRIVNPESGRIWTANARVVDGQALRVIGDGAYALGARAQQIRDNLFAIEEFSAEDMLSVQLDDRAIFLSRWRDLLLDTLHQDAISDNEGRAQFRQLVENWIPRAAAESVGFRLVRRFRIATGERVIAMVMQPVLEKYGADAPLAVSNQFEGPLWSMVTTKPAHLLGGDYSDWNELLLQAVDTSIKYFTDNFDGGLESRTWGERNTAAIRHPLSSAVPFLSRWLDMPPDQLPGATDLPRAQGPAFGASERFAVSPGDEASGYLHMPSGQSGHPLSDFYLAGHDDWVHGRPTRFLPGPPAYTLTLIAAD